MVHARVEEQLADACIERLDLLLLQNVYRAARGGGADASRATCIKESIDIATALEGREGIA
jgi:hypothetical protein